MLEVSLQTMLLQPCPGCPVSCVGTAMAMAIAQAPAQGISFADTNPTIGVVSGEVVVTRVPGLVLCDVRVINL